MRARPCRVAAAMAQALALAKGLVSLAARPARATARVAAATGQALALAREASP